VDRRARDDRRAAGAIQVPPDGRPIVLLADAQPTGGYPVPAVVIRADLPVLGQLAPGDEFRFVFVSSLEARAILRADRDAFEKALAHLHEAAGWDDLWHGAGG
jgi:antagonist of KipI